MGKKIRWRRCGRLESGREWKDKKEEWNEGGENGREREGVREWKNKGREGKKREKERENEKRERERGKKTGKKDAPGIRNASSGHWWSVVVWLEAASASAIK